MSSLVFQGPEQHQAFNGRREEIMRKSTRNIRFLAGLLTTLACMSAASQGDRVVVPGQSSVKAVAEEIEGQIETVESASAALTAALHALKEAQTEKPDRNAPKYYRKGDDGETVFAQDNYDADMSQWQNKIARLTTDINNKQAALAAEESKLANLQSKMGGAISADNRKRMEALEREREEQEREFGTISARFNDDVSGDSPKAEIRRLNTGTALLLTWPITQDGDKKLQGGAPTPRDDGLCVDID